MKSNSNLVVQLEGRIADAVRTDPRLSQELTELIIAVESGDQSAIEYAERLITHVQDHADEIPKTFCTVPSEIRVSITGGFRNKQVDDRWVQIQTDAGFNQVKGRGVMAHLFKARTTTIKDFAELICKGYAFGIGVYKNSHRDKKNFISSQLLALDFDESVSIDDLLGVAFIRHYATCLYPTPSHTPECPKTRVVFVLENLITDGQQWEAYQEALLFYFQNFRPDSSCKDCSRFFYGSDIEGAVFNFETALPLLVCDQLLEAYEWHKESERIERMKRQAQRRANIEPMNDKRKSAYADKAINDELRQLSMAGQGGRNNQLFTTACNLLGMAKSGEWGVTEGWVITELERAGTACGLPAHEVERTIQSALKSAEPRYMEV